MSMSGPQAFALAQHNNPSKSWYRRCQEFVRTALGLPGGSGSAREAYEAALDHRAIHTDRNPPADVPVFWDTDTDPKGPDHVALSAGGGMVWSNDAKSPGKIDLVPLSTIDKWGRYEGWGTYLNGKTLTPGAVSGTGVGGPVFNDAGFVPDIPGTGLDDAVDRGIQAPFKATGNVIGDGISAAAGALWDPLGGFFTKAGFVVLGLGMTGLGIYRMSQSPSAAGRAVAAPAAPIRKANAKKAELRGAALGAATGGKTGGAPPAKAPKPAAAAPTTPPRSGRAAPRPRPAGDNEPIPF